MPVENTEKLILNRVIRYLLHKIIIIIVTNIMRVSYITETTGYYICQNKQTNSMKF